MVKKSINLTMVKKKFNNGKKKHLTMVKKNV